MVKRVALISTGGTIDKTYDEFEGILHNEVSVLDMMIASLKLEGIELERIALMHKDSLDMSADDHNLIAHTAGNMAATHDGVVIVHGTDRLADTGERIVQLHPEPPTPIVLTGAMRPYVMRTSDAIQNFTEALLAVQLCAPGVYVAIHNRVLAFPGVVKDRENLTFVRTD